MSYTTELELSTDGPISWSDRQLAEERDRNDYRRDTLILKLDLIKAYRERLNFWIDLEDAERIAYWRDSLSFARRDWMRRNASRRANRSV